MNLLEDRSRSWSRGGPASRTSVAPLVLLLGFLLLVPVAASGETGTGEPGTKDFSEMSLEELMEVKVSKVYGASKREQSLADAPASVTIITSQDIQHYGYRTLADILNSARGLYVTNNHGYSFLGVRGFNRPGDYGGRNLLLLDGQRLNEPIFDSAALGHDFILDVDLIDRVEIVRGPGSTLYGNNAFFSVVNVIPKRGRDYRWAEASVSGGSFDTYQGRFTLGHQFVNGLEFVFSGTYFDTAGQKRIHFRSADPTTPLPNGGVAEDLDDESNYSLFTQWHFGDFTLAGAYNSREKDVPHASYGAVFNDPTYQTTDRQAFVDLKFERAWEHDWSVFARLNYNQYIYDSDSAYDFEGTGNPSDYTINYDWARARWFGTEAQVGKTLWERVTLMTGAEFREYFQERYQNEDRDPPEIYTDIDDSDRIWGFFVNTEILLYGRSLVLNAGVRYDGFSAFDPSVNPRAALIGRPWEKTTLKFLYGEAYRAPNVYEANYGGFGVLENPGLQPETIRTYEVVWEQQYGRYFRSSLGGYLNQIDDLIARESVPGTDLIQMVNRGRVKGEGVEVELEGRHPSGLRGRVSYAWQQTRDRNEDRSLSNSPRHLAKVNLVVPLYRDRMFAGLELRYRSAAKSVYDTEVDSFWLMNATLFTQQFVKGLEFSVSAYNLLDQDYAFPGGPEHSMDEIPQAGRSVQGKLTYRF